MTISNESRSRIKAVFEPIALAMGRAGLTPDALTLIGFVITAVGAILLAMQQWLLGGLVVFFGGVFDMFDGTLARATGQDERLDPERCRRMYEEMLPLDDVLRASGQFGPKVEVAGDADSQTKLLAFIGRTP